MLLGVVLRRLPMCQTVTYFLDEQVLTESAFVIRRFLLKVA
jgi:hypothetical protein